MPHKAMFFNKTGDSRVQCFLCPHHCVIKLEGWGICSARKNIDGELYSMNYGRIASFSLDPIEKKPLYRFMPGSMILSAGTFGCNLKCSFCQNWKISSDVPETYEVTSGEIVRKALELRERGNIGIAYTYNEPSIWYEFVLETAIEAQKNGLYNVLVTNGFIEKEPLMEILPYTDAMNIDLKAFADGFYKKVCGGTLEAVKRTIEIAAKGCHLEVTTLVIPGLNDSSEEIDKLSGWLASVSEDITLHLSRFFPNHKMTDRPATPLDTMHSAQDSALRHLKHVYLGNVH